MKYYIPTSSLNLDNILQSESISPFSFYAQRKTGYRSIELIDEVKSYNNYILLFDYPVSFSIDDPNRYNFPLLIEIDDDIQLRDIKMLEEHIWLCNHTIYLTPQNSSFYFYSEKDCKLTTINTKDNKSIKYYDKYKVWSSVSNLKTRPISVVHSKAKLDVGESYETIIDKQKGVLFASLLGQLVSVTPELSRLLMLSQKLYDILTSIIPLPQKNDSLMNNLEGLLNEFKSIDPIERRSKDIFDNNLNKEFGRCRFLKQLLIDFLRKWRVWDLLFQRMSSEWRCEFMPDVKKLNTSQDFSLLRDKIENHTNRAIEEYQKEQQTPSVDAISVVENEINIKDKPIINRAINYIIQEQLTVDSLSADRLKICMNLITEVRDEIQKSKGDKYWEDSLERKYVNKLYSHVKDNISNRFNLKEIDDVELVAVAAFLLHGENFSTLMTYLKMNEVSDYHSVLLLWGALCGYMGMNRDVFPKEFLTVDNYRSVYQRLFSNRKMPSNPESGNVIIQDYLLILSKIMNEGDTVFAKLQESLSTCDIIDLEKCIHEIFNSDRRCSAQSKKAWTAYQLVLARDDEKRFNSILADIVPKKSRSEIASLLGLMYSDFNQEHSKSKDLPERDAHARKKKKVHSSKELLESNLFENGTNEDVIVNKTLDYQSIEDIMQFISLQIRGLDKDQVDCIKEDLEWSLNPEYVVSLNCEQKISNIQKRLVDGKTLSKGSKGGNMTWKNKLYKDIDIDGIVKCLHEYLDK